MIPRVSVALPVHRDEGRLARAIRCITDQTLREIEILIVLNGADAPARDAASKAAAADHRIRVLELPEANLSAALNLALREARHDLVARMDGDDECPPTRFALQAEFLASHPETAALGTAFEGIDEEGRTIGIERPPMEAGEVRWRLCLGNCLCHGSMMLRRSVVRGVGGYDERTRFAQDYDLWLRLSRSHAIANLPHVLYRYRTSLAKRHEAQARAAAGAMTREWARLPVASLPARNRIAAALAEATWGGVRARAALVAIETLLTEEGPSPEGLLAWQSVAAKAGASGLAADELSRLERVREAGRRLRERGVTSVWLYGAGRHTAWLLENPDALGVEIAGIADDALAGARRQGFCVLMPHEIPTGAHLLLSSDAQEERLWEAAAPLRERGVTVWRLHTRATPGGATSGSRISPPGISIGA